MVSQNHINMCVYIRRLCIRHLIDEQANVLWSLTKPILSIIIGMQYVALFRNIAGIGKQRMTDFSADF